jgi:hypothetical protein
MRRSRVPQVQGSWIYHSTIMRKRDFDDKPETLQSTESRRSSQAGNVVRPSRTDHRRPVGELPVRRRHRPALGQLMLLFTAALGDPYPVAARPPVVARERRPETWQIDRPSWRPRRARNETRPPETTMARKVDRFVRRGAHCCLCHTWPAPVESWVNGQIMLVCRSCSGKPNTLARLREIAAVEWN